MKSIYFENDSKHSDLSIFETSFLKYLYEYADFANYNT